MQLSGNGGQRAAAHCTLFAILLNWLYKGAMTKPDDEIPESYAGLTGTDHTPFKQTVEAELEKMALRLHYTPNVFQLANILGGDESGSKVVFVGCLEKHTIKVTVPMDNSAAFAQAFEAALLEFDEYRERFEQADSEND